MSDLNLVNWALRYAEIGWPVFPCHTPTESGCSCNRKDCDRVGKHPRTRHGVKDATTDPDQIKRWWGMWPDANIALACGVTCDVLDVDPQKGGSDSLATIQRLHEPLPITMQSRTGGGGFHFFFRPSTRQLVNAVEFAGGLDLRTNGGFVILPPSLHASGKRYVWEAPPGDYELADFPEWLADLVVGVLPKRTSEVSAGSEIAQGSRNNLLFELGCAMRRRGSTQETIYMTLFLENSERCHPPLSESEVRRIAMSAARYKPEEKVADSAPPDIHEQKPAMQVKSYWEMRGVDFPEIKWVVPELLPEGLTVFAGRMKSGKSHLALSIAAAVACGGYVLGETPVEPGDVLYLALEDNDRRMIGRLNEIFDTHEIERETMEPMALDYVTEMPRLNKGGIEQLRGWLGDHKGCRLVVIDVLSKIRPMGQNTSGLYDEDYGLMGSLQKLALEFNVCIMAIHHTSKAKISDYVFDEISGTTAIAAGADTLWVIKEDQSGHSTLHVRGRDVEPAELALRFEIDIKQWVLLGEAAEISTTAERQEVLDLLDELDEPVTPREVADMLGRQTGSCARMLSRMFRAEQVSRSGRGRYVSKNKEEKKDEDKPCDTRKAGRRESESPKSPKVRESESPKVRSDSLDGEVSESPGQSQLEFEADSDIRTARTPSDRVMVDELKRLKCPAELIAHFRHSYKTDIIQGVAVYRDLRRRFLAQQLRRHYRDLDSMTKSELLNEVARLETPGTQGIRELIREYVDAVWQEV